MLGEDGVALLLGKSVVHGRPHQDMVTDEVSHPRGRGAAAAQDRRVWRAKWAAEAKGTSRRRHEKAQRKRWAARVSIGPSGQTNDRDMPREHPKPSRCYILGV